MFRGVARTTDDPEVLHQLSFHWRASVRQEVIDNPHTTHKTLQSLVDRDRVPRGWIGVLNAHPGWKGDVTTVDESKDEKILVSNETEDKILAKAHGKLAEVPDLYVNMGIGSNPVVDDTTKKKNRRTFNDKLVVTMTRVPTSTVPIEESTTEDGELVKAHVALAKTADLTTRLKLASSSPHPEVHEVLSKDDSPVVREIVADNKTTQPDLLHTMATRDTQSLVRAAVTTNPNTRDETLKMIADKDSDLWHGQEAVRVLKKRAKKREQMLAESNELEQAHMALADFKGNNLVRGELAMTTTSPKVLHKLAQSDDRDIHDIVARSEHASKETQMLLYKKGDARTRMYLARSPHTHTEVLHHMRENEPDWHIHRVARENIMSKIAAKGYDVNESKEDEVLIKAHGKLAHQIVTGPVGTLPDDEAEEMYLSIAKGTKNQEVIEKAAKSPYSADRHAVARNPSTPAHILALLADDENEYTRASVAKHPNTEPSTLHKLGTDYYSATHTKQNVVYHVNTPIKTLRHLIHDDNHVIADHARERLWKEDESLAESNEDELLNHVKDNLEKSNSLLNNPEYGDILRKHGFRYDLRMSSRHKNIDSWNRPDNKGNHSILVGPLGWGHHHIKEPYTSYVGRGFTPEDLDYHLTTHYQIQESTDPDGEERLTKIHLGIINEPPPKEDPASRHFFTKAFALRSVNHEETIRKFSTHESGILRLAVASNKNAPKDVLNHLLKDKSQSVRETARRNLAGVLMESTEDDPLLAQAKAKMKPEDLLLHKWPVEVLKKHKYEPDVSTTLSYPGKIDFWVRGGSRIHIGKNHWYQHDFDHGDKVGSSASASDIDDFLTKHHGDKRIREGVHDDEVALISAKNKMKPDDLQHHPEYGVMLKQHGFEYRFKDSTANVDVYQRFHKPTRESADYIHVFKSHGHQTPGWSHYRKEPYNNHPIHRLGGDNVASLDKHLKSITESNEDESLKKAQMKMLQGGSSEYHLSNSDADSAAFNVAVRSHDPDVLRAAAKHPNATVRMSAKKRMLKLKIKESKKDPLKAAHDKIIDDPKHNLRWTLTQNATLSDEQLQAIIDHPRSTPLAKATAKVKLRLRQGAKHLADVDRVFTMSGDDDVPELLPRNESLTSRSENGNHDESERTKPLVFSHLMVLESDDDLFLRKAHLNLSKPDSYYKAAEDLATHTKDSDLHHELSKHHSQFVRGAVAANPYVNEPVLRHLSRDSSGYVRIHVAANHNTHPDVLHELSYDNRGSVRGQVAANPKTDSDTLIRMADNDDSNHVANHAHQSLINRGLREDGEVANVTTDSGALAYQGQKRLGNTRNKSKRRRKRLIEFISESDDLLRNAHKSISKTDIHDEPDIRTLSPLAQSSVDPEVLHNIATTWSDNLLNNGQIHGEVARNPHTSKSTLNFLAGHELSSVRGHVASNRNTSTDTLKMLANDEISYVRQRAQTRLDSYPVPMKESDDLLRKAHMALASDHSVPDIYVYHDLLANPTLKGDPELLTKMSNSPHAAIRHYVASQKNTPHHVLDKLSRDQAYHVKSAVMTNPDTPSDLLDDMARRHKPDAITNPEHLRTHRRIAKHPNTSARTLHYLSNSSDPDVVENVAENANTAPKTLKKIIAHPDIEGMRWAKIEAIRNPNVSQEVLHTAAHQTEKEGYMAGYAASNPKTHVDDLNKLANHESRFVRRHVYRNPSTPIELKQRIERENPPEVLS